MVKDGKAYVYAKWCVEENVGYAPIYVKKQCKSWLQIADGNDEDAFVDEKSYEKICKLLKLMVHPDLRCSIYDGLEDYAWLFIVATLCTKLKNTERDIRFYTTAVLEIARKNFKTFNSAIIFILLMLTEPDFSRFFSVAPDLALSSELKLAIRKIIKVSPALYDEDEPAFKILRSQIICLLNDNEYTPLAYSNDGMDGKMAHAFLADECGAMDEYPIEAMRSSQITLFNKLGIIIMVQGKRYFPEQFVRVLRNTRDGMKGIGIVEENSKILSVSYNSLKYEEGLVKTGGNKKGFVKSAKNLTQEAMDKLKAAWRKLYSNNTENVIILNNGLEFQEASNTSVEMQLNENKQTNAKEIRTILGVPDNIGTEQGDKAFIKYCVNAFLGAFMVALNKSMLLEAEKEDYFFAADTYELTKGDADKRFGAYKEAIETGWMQVDEVREKENMEPLGLEFIKLGLQDVLYDPKTKVVYTPNTNQSNRLGGEKEGQELKLEQMETEKKSSLTDMSTLQTETADQSQTEKEDISLKE